MTPRQFAIEITQQLQSAGFEALWAGGCVRDALLGREPKDYDVATSAHPEQVRELFGYNRTLPIGASFGVITVVGPKSAGQIEVATFRNDGSYSDGRRPDSVEYSTAREDAMRRDFTINGLFFDPVREQVIDYVDGRLDLEKRQIRAIGDPAERIEEDKLRMLRAVRFAATFDFALDPTTALAIRERSRQLSVVSRERTTAELRRMLAHPNRKLAVQLLVDLKLLPEIFEGMNPPAVFPSHATMKTLERLSKNSFPLSLAALVSERSATNWDARKLDQRFHQWKMSNDEIRSTIWIRDTAPKFLSAVATPWPEIQRLLIHEDAHLALDLAEASLDDGPDASSESLQSVNFCREKIALPHTVLNPDPLLTGDDLRAAGYRPGPAFKTTLNAVRDAQLNGEIQSFEQAMDLAKSNLKPEDC